MLQNAYFLAKIGADAAENEQHFAEPTLSGSPRAPESVGWHAGGDADGLRPDAAQREPSADRGSALSDVLSVEIQVQSNSELGRIFALTV